MKITTKQLLIAAAPVALAIAFVIVYFSIQGVIIGDPPKNPGCSGNPNIVCIQYYPPDSISVSELLLRYVLWSAVLYPVVVIIGSFIAYRMSNPVGKVARKSKSRLHPWLVSALLGVASWLLVYQILSKAIPDANCNCLPPLVCNCANSPLPSISSIVIGFMVAGAYLLYRYRNDKKIKRRH